MKITINTEKREYKQVPAGTRNLTIVEAKSIPSGAPQQIQIRFKDVETGATLLKSYKYTSSGAMFYFGKMLKVALGLSDGDSFDTMGDAERLIGITLECIVSVRDFNGKNYADIDEFVRKVSENKNAETVNEDDLPF